jgi:hypothetical protein
MRFFVLIGFIYISPRKGAAGRFIVKVFRILCRAPAICNYSKYYFAICPI